MPGGLPRILVQHWFVVTLWVVMLVGVAWVIRRPELGLHTVTLSLNLVTAGLFGIQVVSVAWPFLTATELGSDPAVEEMAGGGDRVRPLPSIYYVIMDGYGSAETLQRVYSYDNCDFLDFLRREGFYIVPRAGSNYNQTMLSLASSLNFTYLDEIARELGFNSRNRRSLRRAIWRNRTAQYLKSLGYETVVFSSGYAGTDGGVGADRFYKPAWALSELENLLINLTPIGLLMNRLNFPNQFEFHRNRILYILEKLATLEDGGPVFAFAHIICPHPPFVFGANGERKQPLESFTLADDHFQGTQEEYIEGYRDQLTFINAKLKELVRRIKEKSGGSAIMILQGDHGPRSGLESDLRERLSILNALNLPGAEDALYESLTPVNTFRVVLNAYFDADLELLQDRSYFAEWRRPYDFTDVTEQLRSEVAAEQ